MANNPKKMTDGTVVKIIDEFNLVINRGRDHGVSLSDRFLVYCLDKDELIDPETRESLGKLEIVRGRGRVSHLQDKMCTINSDRFSNKPRTVKKQINPFASSFFNSEIIEESSTVELPFENPQIGDIAKLL